MKITTAIIPVAGYGTRRLPITKAIEKCMLPIGNRPIVDYVVEDCVRAGVRDIWFVVGEDSRQIREYFGHNRHLEKYLRERGKTDMLAQIQPPQNVRFHFVEQPADGKYGTTIPVALALAEIGTRQPVAVIMGDDFLYNPTGESDIARLLAAVENDGEAALLGVKVPRELTPNYGVITLNKQGHFSHIVERPAAPADAPSDLINVSKYVLPPRVQELILQHFGDRADFPTTSDSGEYYIIDPINAFVAAGGVVKVVANRGEYLDGGNLAGWLHANAVVGRDLLKS